MLVEDDRLVRYAELVRKRKSCDACEGLANPATFKDGAYDSDQIGAWSLWQGNLKAKLMAVGQDWGTCKYAEDNHGRDKEPTVTNNNLIKLLGSRGYLIRRPVYSPAVDTDLFFTNGILCLKSCGNKKTKKGMQSDVEGAWYANCGTAFLRPTIELVRPKIVVSLGKAAYLGILRAYCLGAEPKFRVAVERVEPLTLGADIKYYPVYHCSASGANRNRCWDQQLQDWSKIPKATDLAIDSI